MELIDSKKCTGCGACMKACPQNAIAFIADNEGFPGPIINQSKCVNCGICKNVCPILYSPMTEETKAAYAAQILDQDVLKESTSGGVFTVLSREVFKRHGIVYGCIWDGNYNAIIASAENENELAPMRGSKYVWSWAGDTYPEIKQNLENGRFVMFSGMPCQVAGLKNYLHKNYDNLLLVDFFCGGAPSPFAFQEYIKTITRKVPTNQLDFKFRDKSKYGSGGVNISYNTRRGRKHESFAENPYFYSYHTKVFHRQSCYECKFRYRHRCEDITMGDYWGIHKFYPELSVEGGISALLVNTDKGMRFVDAVKQDIKLTETKIEHIAASNNLTLNDKVIKFSPPGFREDFFKYLRSGDWSKAERKYLGLDKQRFKLRSKLFIKRRIPAKWNTYIKKLLNR